MPNDLILEAFFMQSNNCKIIGVLTAALEYAHVFGHEVYSIYGLFEMAFVPISIFIYAVDKFDERQNKRIFNLIVACLILTLFSTQTALLIFPNIARSLSSASFDEDLRSTFSNYNIASYNLLFNYVVIAPIFLLISKTDKKVFFISIFVLLVVVIVYSQLFSSFLLLIINLVVFFLLKKFKIKTI
jgi:hypothetical protein